MLTKVIDSKEGILKLADILIEEISTLCIHTTSPLIALWVVETIKVESRSRHFPIGGTALREQFPKGLGVGGFSWQTATCCK